MNIIPAIDIIDGKCVRLTQGNYNQRKIYNEHPLEVAKQFEDHGIQYLHLVDLDGARANTIVNTKILEQIAGNTNLKIDFGGGLKTDEAIRIAFECGAHQVTGGSIAIKNKALFLKWVGTYGNNKIILGADIRNEKIAVNGWTEDTAINVFDFIAAYVKEGIQYIICTDISKDGLMKGSATDLYQKILKKFKDIKLIASGGIASIDELKKLSNIGVYGAIIGKAIYEGKITMNELQLFLTEKQ